jgi:hypothetical protein
VWHKAINRRITPLAPVAAAQPPELRSGKLYLAKGKGNRYFY